LKCVVLWGVAQALRLPLLLFDMQTAFRQTAMIEVQNLPPKRGRQNVETRVMWKLWLRVLSPGLVAINITKGPTPAMIIYVCVWSVCVSGVCVWVV